MPARSGFAVGSHIKLLRTRMSALPAKHVGQRHALKDLANGVQSRLGSSVSRGQAELPIFDVLAAPMPFIGPGEHENAGATPRKRRARLPLKRACLRRFAASQTVQAHL